MAGTPRLLCINLASHRERRARMERRLAHHGLRERTTFVEAIEPAPPREPTAESKDAAGRACFASHLRAMRTLLDYPETAADGALICENDVLLHNEFGPRLRAALRNLPAGAPLLTLGYFVGRWDPDFTWAGRRPELRNVCRMVPGALWSSHLYWIAPAYARACLERWGEDPVEDLPSMTETIAFEASGYAAFPSLAVQDAIDSTIRPAEELDFHITGQAAWPYPDYAACEEGDDRSPLAAQPSPRRTIGLCMIVRDEAAVIERCLAAARPLIDSWTIVDTGSTDRTPELVEAALGGIPGQLCHREWRDFGANRSELMELALGSADYLLLIDADMTVEWRGPLPRPLAADAYLLRHAGSLAYSVPRLVRGDRRWWFEGSTHEYLATEGEFTQEPLEALLVHHHADSGTRAEKLERDRRLLERAIEHDPADARATFYLAQTLRDAGETARAIELYRRRVELGGWDEEVFYAAFQVGGLTGHEDPEAAIPALLDAHERRPSRAEPLLELAHLARLQGRHRAAYLFARAAAELPQPEDILFVHRDVYEWRARFELSVAAYWVGEREQALAISDELLAEGALPGEFEAAVRQNRSYCLAALGRPERAGGWPAPELDSLVPGLELGEIVLDVEPNWPALNPSIARDGDGFRAIVRTASYRLRGGVYEFLDGQDSIRTLNYLVALGPDLAIRGVEPLVDLGRGPERHPSAVEGFEDCRLVAVGGSWFASATVRDRDPDGTCQMVLLALDGAEIAEVRVLAGPEPGRHEKNWMPFVADGALRFVYSCSPTVLLDAGSERDAPAVVSERPGPDRAREWRGGSQGVPVDDGLLFCVHQAYDGPRGRTYGHRLVLLGDDLAIAAATPEFSITGDPIELCAGMAARGGELVLSFGAGDRAAGLAVLPLDRALGLLEPLR